MTPDVAARVDAYCDAFEQSWKSGALTDVGSFLASQVENDFRHTVLPHLLAVDAEYRRARDGSAPSLAEYAVLLNVDLSELQKLSDDATWMTSAAVTPVAGNRELVAAKGENAITSGLDRNTRMPEIDGYEIFCELGRGGMGVVYKARQIRAGRIVALKTIRAPHLAASERTRRFQGEAIAAARLNHHGIVPVYEVGQHNELYYFSMGFVDGVTLEAKARDQILSSREAAKICRDLADALEYAHQNGVIHRDVKPHNVLMGNDAKPRLTDFGLAKLTDGDQDLTSTGQVMGTAAYMAPEQARGNHAMVGPSTDVYSLGATLYRCVTGRPPFQASTTIEILRQLHEDEPISPRRLNQEVDIEIETICLKCLEKEPWRRFQSAGEMAAELNRYLNREPIHSRPIGPLARAWRWCLRRPASAASVFMAIMLLTVMAAGIPLFLLQQNKLQLAELQRQRDVDARGKAENARQAEEQARKQAETLAAANAARAATQEYFVSIMKVRELQMQPEPRAGWTWEALNLLQKAATSDADGKDPVAVRSLIADTLVTPDLREIGRIEGVPNTHSIDVSHDGKLLAAGDYGGNPSQIRLYRIKTTWDDNQPRVQFELFRECSVNTTVDGIQGAITDLGLGAKATNSEGMWSLDFSPDDKHIAVGTRNGNITIWQIDCDPPRILFDRRFPETHIAQIRYSADGRRLIAQHRIPPALRVVNVVDQTDRVTHYDEDVNFSLLPDDRVVISHGERLFRASTSESSESIQLTETDGPLNLLAADQNLPFAIVGTAPPVVLDPETGEKTFVLEHSTSAPGRPRELVVAADSTLAIAAVEPQNIRMWDATSGKRAIEISYPGYEPPIVCAGSERDRVYVYSTVSMIGYQLRCAQSIVHENHGHALFKDLAAAPSPQAVVVPGAQRIASFALSDDEQHIAVVEAASVHGLTTIPDGYRASLRKLNARDGTEAARWTCLLLHSGQDRNILTEGDSVAFVEHDRKIAFTTPAVGNIAVVSEAGFEFPSGVGIDVIRSPATLDSSESVHWDGGTVAAGSKIAGSRAAITLKLPRRLSRPNERLRIRLIMGETTQEYDLTDRHLVSPGWHLIMLDQIEQQQDPGNWRVDAILEPSDLRFAAKDDESGEVDGLSILPGDFYLIPWQRVRRGKSSHSFPLRLGPLSSREDGGLLAVVESWTLHQWSPDLSAVDGVPWRDSANDEEDIRGFSKSRNGHFVGTDSGLVAMIKPDGGQDLIEGAHTENGSYDSRDGVLSAAVVDSVNLAVVGTLRGQIKVYDLTARTKRPVYVADAHSREIVAIATTENGQLLASADAEGALRFWKRHADRLELLFEMTATTSPIQSMQFSQDGGLYLLRHGHRAVMRLELEDLAAHFRNCGLTLPDVSF